MDNNIHTNHFSHEDESKDLSLRISSSTDILSFLPDYSSYADFDFGHDAAGFDPCDSLGQACDQQCDPNSVVPCTSVDANPCYDPTCSPRCELDGMDTSCYQFHGNDSLHQIQQAYNRPNISYRREPPPQHLPNINRSVSINTMTQSHGTNHLETSSGICFHPEHEGKGCINPQLLMLNGSSCCCEDPTHKPDIHNAITRASQKHTRPRSAPRRERKNMYRGRARISSSESTNAQTDLSRMSMEFSTGATTPFDQPVPVPFHQQASLRPDQLLPTQIYQQIPTQLDQHMFGQPHQQVFTPHTNSTQTPSPAQPYQQVFTPESNSSQTLSPCMSPQCRWVTKETGHMCGMIYSSAADLQAHVEQNHLPQRRKSGTTERLPIVCCWENCEHAHNEKAFRQNQHLKDHIRTHTQHKPFECTWDIDDDGTICGKGFGEKKALDSHMRTHTKEKPFKCGQCEKTFAHQSTLSAHLIKHTTAGEKKYQCPKCGHMDNDRANLSRHWDTHYPPRYMCKLCKKTFSKKANAIRHLNNRSCKCMPVGFSEAELRDSIFCQPREMGDIDFSAFETNRRQNPQ